MRSVAFLALASVPLCSVPVTADDLATAMVGVWNITEFSRKDVASGTAEKPYGAHPKGRIIFTKGGNNIWFLVSENQPRPAAVAPTDPERAELFKNMFAFAGTYKVEGAHLTQAIHNWHGCPAGRQVVLQKSRSQATRLRSRRTRSRAR